MREYVTLDEAVFAVLAGITGVAGSYAAAGYTRQFVVAPIDAIVVRATPGRIVAFMIQNVGDEAHYLHIGLSMAIAAGLFAVAALFGFAVARWLEQSVAGVVLAGGLAWGLVAAITSAPELALGAAVPVALFTAIGVRPLSAPGHDPSRRRVLASGVSALAVVGLSVGIGRRLTDDGPDSGGSADGSVSGDDSIAGLEQETETGPSEGGDEADDEPADEPTRLVRAAQDQSLDLAGEELPGLVSSIDEFYNVDIAEFDPEVPADDWSMTITGEVEADVTRTFADLTEMPVEHRYVTLRCVGEDLNGRKLDTAVWTGTPLRPLLEEADPNGECGCAMLRAEDDYFVQFPVEALEDAFLAWGMNGEPLPQSHGHPVRVLVPGHWGETNVKWLDEIELLDEEMDGYWEQRGWHGTGPVNTVAKLWDDTRLDDGRIEVAGHAYAGTRGIERVEVSVDGGDTWVDAELSEPLPGEDVWRQWRYVYEPDGPHEVVVRATDGEGTLQSEEESESYPSGATGWVSQRIEP